MTDEELYASFLCGEDAALAALMERHLEPLALFCFTYLHSAAEAEEAALDAFAAVALKRSLWRGGSFQRWLYRIARNLAVSRYRALGPWHLPLDEASCPAALSAESVYFHLAQREHVQALLQRLPPEERQVLTLLYQEHLGYAQAAQRLGVTQKRVDNLAYRGKKRLRAWLREEE